MISKQMENEALTKEFKSREAGVTELLELYDRIEADYIIASQALKARDITTTSNSTNSE